MTTQLQRLYAEQHQSPWLDTMSRDLIQHGALQQLVGEGIRGATVNPAIVEQAVAGTSAYDREIRTLENPAYRDVRYVEELIGPDSVTTIPLQTVSAFQDHGRVERTIDRNVEGAHYTLEQIRAVGIDLRDVTETLLRNGIGLFSEALQRLDGAIAAKTGTLRESRPDESGSRRVGHTASGSS
jgi:transaldolase